MPGLIIDVCVKPGDKVTRGQHMMALEAMKMKNSIRSPRDAVIASVAVADQQKVAYNDLLVTFE
jgi:biotin carboxyl carrier protein